MKAIVKTIWKPGKKPILKLATENGYNTIKLEEGLKLDLEITDKRKCTGFYKDEGKMKPCPEYRDIDSGSQCQKCRKKDIYTSWRTGKGTPGLDKKYSVYLVQSGNQVKVGVTKTGRLKNRWLEQGADYAAEIHKDLTAKQALKKEKQLSQQGLKEQIRKENKIKNTDKKLLKQKMDEHNLEGEIKTFNNNLNCKKLVRKGRFPKPVEKVKGKIVSNGKIGMVMTPGKKLQKPRQKGLTEF